MNKNILAALLVVSMVPAMFLILLDVSYLTGTDNSITGNVVYDDNVKNVCSTNSDCSAQESCCMFDGKDSGVCNEESKCVQIVQLTMNTVSDKKDPMIQMPTTVSDSKLSDSFGVAIFFGFAIAALILSVGYTVSSFIDVFPTNKNSSPKVKESIKKNDIKLTSAKTSKKSKFMALHHVRDHASKLLTKHINSINNISDDQLEKYIVGLVGLVGLVAILIIIM